MALGFELEAGGDVSSTDYVTFPGTINGRFKVGEKVAAYDLGIEEEDEAAAKEAIADSPLAETTATATRQEGQPVSSADYPSTDSGAAAEPSTFPGLNADEIAARAESEQGQVNPILDAAVQANDPDATPDEGGGNTPPPPPEPPAEGAAPVEPTSGIPAPPEGEQSIPGEVTTTSRRSSRSKDDK